VTKLAARSLMDVICAAATRTELAIADSPAAARTGRDLKSECIVVRLLVYFTRRMLSGG